MSLMDYGFTKTKQSKNSSQQSPGKPKSLFEEKLKEADATNKQKTPTKKLINTPKPKSSHQSKDSNSVTPVAVKKVAPKKFHEEEEGLSYSPFTQKSATDLSLPPQRVKMIMKSCPDVEIVPQEALHIVAKATELFIQNLAQESLDASNDKYRLDYESLSKHVHSTGNLEFLKETVPKKLTLEECQQIIARNRANRADDCL